MTGVEVLTDNNTITSYITVDDFATTSEEKNYESDVPENNEGFYLQRSSTGPVISSFVYRYSTINPKEQACDYICCAPKCCQCFRNVKCAVFSQSVVIFIQAMFMSGFRTGILTTLERRFALSSNDLGVFSVMTDLGTLIFLVPAAFYGGRKMRAEAVGLFLMGLASILFFLPHLLTGYYQPQPPVQPLCFEAYVKECKEESRSSHGGMKWIFWSAQFLFGVGASPIYSIGMAYVDENARHNRAFLYYAIMNSNVFSGAAAGSLLAGQVLDIYIHITPPKDVPITPKNRHVWLGAWWIGPLVTASACIAISIPLFGLPKYMPNYQEIQIEKMAARKRRSSQPSERFVPHREGLKPSLRLLFKNVILLLVITAATNELAFLSSFGTFGPKYLETTFDVPSNDAPRIIGVTIVVAGASGILLGGIITKKRNFSLGSNLKMLSIISLMNIAPLCGFFISCSDRQPIHLTEQPCNERCNCSATSSFFQPGCGADGQSYFSPCFAGCTDSNANGFFNCTCITRSDRTQKEWTNKVCPTKCAMGIMIFVIITFIAVFFTGLSISPGINSVLRCVQEGVQSLALGLIGLCSRLFGSIPGPLIMASLIDSTCRAWNQNCGRRGNCQDYHQRSFQLVFFAFGCVTKCCSILALNTALVYHYRLQRKRSK